MFLKTSYWVRVRSPAAKTEGPRPGEMSSQAHPGHSPCPKYSKRSKLVIVWYSLKLLPRDLVNIKKLLAVLGGGGAVPCDMWESHFPDQGLNPCSQQQKHGVQSTGLPGKSQEYLIRTVFITSMSSCKKWPMSDL